MCKKILKRTGWGLLVVITVILLPVVDEGLNIWKDYIHRKFTMNPTLVICSLTER